MFDGAFVNLEQWASKGIAPPRAERITVKDGVATGGVRNPYVDVPAASYTYTSPGPGTCRELGSTIAFDSGKIDSLYGNRKNYSGKVGQSVDRMVRERWITKADGEMIKAEAGK